MRGAPTVGGVPEPRRPSKHTGYKQIEYEIEADE